MGFESVQPLEQETLTTLNFEGAELPKQVETALQEYDALDPAQLEQIKTMLQQDFEEAREVPPTPETATAHELLQTLHAQAQTVVERLRATAKKVELSFNAQERMREECRQLESQLGIETPERHGGEMYLFIDKPFLDVALLRGDEHPEELFGLEAWKGWLEARAYMRNVDTLTVEDIIEVHKLLAQGMDETIPGNIRNIPCAGTDYTNLGNPIKLEPEQIQALKENPYTQWKETDPEQSMGYIIYPDVKSYETDAATTEGLIRNLLQEALDNFETGEKGLDEIGEQKTSTKEIYSKTTHNATLLQRNVVSIHPFRDGNGRLSRLLLNWALEKHAEDARTCPTILDHGEEDLFFSQGDWQNEVMEGQYAYSYITRTTEAQSGRPNTPEELREAMLDEGTLVFFDQAYKNLFPPPPKGAPMRHQEYRDYGQAFFEEADRFYYRTYKYAFANPSHTESAPNAETVRYVGLISNDFIEMWGNTRPSVRKELLDRFYTATEIYRGGEFPKLKDPREILRLFVEPVALNAAYGPLTEAGVSPTSLTTLTREQIQDTLRRYNQLLLHDYTIQEEGATKMPPVQSGSTVENRERRLAKRLRAEEDITKKLTEGHYLDTLIKAHTNATKRVMHLSPAVSTSYKERTAATFSRTHSVNYGIKLSARLPKQGIIFKPESQDTPLLADSHTLHNIEEEMLVMGGIDPNAITRIALYDNTDVRGQLIAEAERTATGEIIFRDLKKNEETLYRINKRGKLVKVPTKARSPADTNAELENTTGKENADWNIGWEEDEYHPFPYDF